MIIGLLGRAGSGKTTVANWLVSERGARRFSFASPLKEMARRIYGLSEAQVYGPQIIKEAVDERFPVNHPGGRSPRELLQFLGTDVCRDLLGADIWVRSAFKLVDADPASLWVCDDLRFSNEAAAIRARGGKIIKLVCPDAPVTPGATHASEAGVDAINPSAEIWAMRSPGSETLLRLARQTCDEMITAQWGRLGDEGRAAR